MKEGQRISINGQPAVITEVVDLKTMQRDLRQRAARLIRAMVYVETDAGEQIIIQLHNQRWIDEEEQTLTIKQHWTN